MYTRSHGLGVRPEVRVGRIYKGVVEEELAGLVVLVVADVDGEERSGAKKQEDRGLWGRGKRHGAP